VELRAEVRSRDPILWVDFYVDGQRAGRLAHPPFTLRVDLGQVNLERHFRVVVADIFGGRAEDEVSTPPIRVDEQLDVALVQVFVSVTDLRGRRVTTLEQGDFEVATGRGRRERIATFDSGDIPMSAVLLLDSSESMQGPPLEAALAGVDAFARLLRPQDEAMVALFSDRLLEATIFGSDRATLRAALVEARAEGGSAINDHLYYALNRLEPRLGRPVILLISDGLDVSSVLDMEEVLWRARRSQATVYWLRLEEEGVRSTPRFLSSWRDADGNERQYRLLEQVVEESGGRTLPLTDLGRIDALLRAVLEEIRGQYVLGFHPAERRGDGSWRPLRVRVRGPGLATRTRTGFVD
jgi:Ca-activated chloride channel homolog